MNEFQRISEFFAPLATDTSVSFGLMDDVAQLGKESWVVTTDTIIEGVHYIGDESPELIAKKLLRCNLSDLAAKGATPKYYTLNLSLNSSCDDGWLEQFAKGLNEGQKQYVIQLIGGDSTSLNGPGVLSATMFGAPHKSNKLPMRTGAKIGDVVCVSGTIGDAAIGLKYLQNKLQISDKEHTDYLVERYQLPEPRVKLGQELAPYLHASMDISDGLMQDAGHIARASGVGIEIYAEQLPISPAVRSLLDSGEITLEDIVSGGDDYEILCTMDKTHFNQAQEVANSLGEELTEIGKIVEGNEVVLLDKHSEPASIAQPGYLHS